MGCTNNIADNYNPDATVDDESCEFIQQVDPQDNIKIRTKLYTATISNRSGGTVIKSTLNEYKLSSGSDQGVILAPFDSKSKNYCNPCLGYKNGKGVQKYVNKPFTYHNEPSIDATKKKKTITFTATITDDDDNDLKLIKEITFNPNSYEIVHE